MAERGMIADALTLVRSCAETAIAIGCLANDEKFVDALLESRDKHRLTSANVHLNDPESLQLLSREDINKLQRVVAEVKEQYPEPGPQAIRWAQAAKEANMTALYDTIYRMTSGDAAHASVDAVDRHVKADERGKIEQLAFRPDAQGVEHTLSVATNALLHAMEAMSRVFPEEGFERIVKACMDRWQAMHPVR